eukprot:scaffold14190_cov102-Isochrysis_galbana.AAC.2
MPETPSTQGCDPAATTMPSAATDAALADAAEVPVASVRAPLEALRATLLEGIRVSDRAHADAARLRASLRELQRAMGSDQRREAFCEDDDDGSLADDDSMGEEDDDEYGGSSSAGSTAGSAAQAPVYLLRCGTCQAELSRRGMQVTPRPRASAG